MLASLKTWKSYFLWGNPITEIPIEIARFQNLKELYLTDIELDTKKFTDFIKACPKSVILTNSLFENTNNSKLLITVTKIAEEWKTLKNVRVE